MASTATGMMNAPADPSTMAPGANYWTPPSGDASGGQNNVGASSDPFAYTGGSLLTPWTGVFNGSAYGGGYSAPAYTPFNYSPLGYQAPNVGSFNEQYQNPAAFNFASFNAPSGFKAPTATSMQQDPGYQARMNAMQASTTAAAAHGGTLNTGGFQRGLASKMGDLASQEYGNVYSRAQQDYAQKYGQAKDVYQINQGNTAQAFNTNTANQLAGYNTRQNAWQANANVGLQQGQLGWTVASGEFDRNEALARQQWQDAANNAQAQASAAASNANASYQHALTDYQMQQNTFYTNQDRQNALLQQGVNNGMNATNAEAGYLSSGYNAMGNQMIGQGNAQAGATQASGAAYGGFAQNMGNFLGASAMYGAAQPGRPPVQNPPYMSAPGSGMPYGGAGSPVSSPFFGYTPSTPLGSYQAMPQ